MKTCSRSRTPIFLFGIRAATLVLVLCMFTLTSSTNAALVTITLADLAPQTEDGQNFTFSFDPVPISDGSDATLRIHARGDYTVGFDAEFLTWSIDGLVSGTASPDSGTVIQERTPHYVEWEDTFTISGEVLSTITSDSLVEITIDISPAVATHWWHDEFVKVEMVYVPEPAALFLLGAGSLLLLNFRRRKA